MLKKLLRRFATNTLKDKHPEWNVCRTGDQDGRMKTALVISNTKHAIIETQADKDRHTLTTMTMIMLRIVVRSDLNLPNEVTHRVGQMIAVMIIVSNGIHKKKTSQAKCHKD